MELSSLSRTTRKTAVLARKTPHRVVGGRSAEPGMCPGSCRDGHQRTGLRRARVASEWGWGGDPPQSEVSMEPADGSFKAGDVCVLIVWKGREAGLVWR